MTAPTLTPTAERLYDALSPLSVGDAASGWVLAHLCQAVTAALWDVESLAADTDTHVGWGPLLDVTQTPAQALPWLGQLVGAVVTPGLSEAQARALVASAPGRTRGTPEAIKAAARLWLSGSQVVTVNERSGGDAYAFEVVVYAGQIIDLTQLTAALNAAKPAGLTMTLTVLSGWTYADVDTRYTASTYAGVDTTWTGLTYADFDRELP